MTHPPAAPAGSSALLAAIASATTVRGTHVGAFDPRHRSRSKPLFVTSDPAALDRLRACLAVDDASFAEAIALMTPGDLDLCFTAGHTLLATVTCLHPTFLRWRGWSSDARLVNPGGLTAWLADHGWRPPPL